MARITSAAELKEALNRLCPEEAWGDKADVERMFDNGLTSLKYIATAEPNLLQSYGVPAFQAGYLRKRAQAAAAGTVVFVVKSECDEYELPLKITDEGILLENVEKNLEMHKPPLRPRSINSMPISLRRDKTLAIDLYDGQRLEMEAEILPGLQPFIAYPGAFATLSKSSMWSWIHT